jgi:hypothetical protein
MKNIYRCLIFVLLISVSCQKDSLTPALKEMLLGNWNYEKLISKSYRADGTLINELVTPISSTDYGYVFYDDGTCTQRFSGAPSKFTYEIISEKEFEINTGAKNICTLISIDKTSIVFSIGSKQPNASNYTTSTHYLIR